MGIIQKSSTPIYTGHLPQVALAGDPPNAVTHRVDRALQAVMNHLDQIVKAVINPALLKISGPDNMLENGAFQSWSEGTSAAPDLWALAIGSAAVAQGTGADVDGFGFGVKVTRSSNDASLSQDILPKRSDLKGQTITFSASVKADTDNIARLYVDDGVAKTTSTLWTGSGFQAMQVVHTIDASATKVECGLEVVTTDGVGTISIASVVQGDLTVTAIGGGQVSLSRMFRESVEDRLLEMTQHQTAVPANVTHGNLRAMGGKVSMDFSTEATKTKAVTFPKAFETALGVVLTIDEGTATAVFVAGAETLAKTGFTARISTADGANNAETGVEAFWFAWGVG